jgi:hypothetical protein
MLLTTLQGHTTPLHIEGTYRSYARESGALSSTDHFEYIRYNQIDSFEQTYSIRVIRSGKPDQEVTVDKGLTDEPSQRSL